LLYYLLLYLYLLLSMVSSPFSNTSFYFPSLRSSSHFLILLFSVFLLISSFYSLYSYLLSPSSYSFVPLTFFYFSSSFPPPLSASVHTIFIFYFIVSFSFPSSIRLPATCSHLLPSYSLFFLCLSAQIRSLG
jgi:hypothetical protein